MATSIIKKELITRNVTVQGLVPVTFMKIGNMVCINIAPMSSQNIPAWGAVDICNLPDGFTSDYNFCGILPRQSNTFLPVYARMKGNKIVLQNQSNSEVTTGPILQFTIAYII